MRGRPRLVVSASSSSALDCVSGGFATAGACGIASGSVVIPATSGMIADVAAGGQAGTAAGFRDVAEPMPRERRALARTIKELRARMDMTQEEVSAEAGLGRGYVSELETGRRRASFESVVRIARALDVPLSELVAIFEARLSD